MPYFCDNISGTSNVYLGMQAALHSKMWAGRYLQGLFFKEP